METRRVVTAQGADGVSRVVGDARVPSVDPAVLPGVHVTTVWGTDRPPAAAPDGAEPAFTQYFPPPGGVRFTVVTLPPEPHAGATAGGGTTAGTHATADTAGPSPGALAEAEQKLPGLVDAFDPSHPGFHRTGTVDLVYVATGRVVLETTGSDPVTLEAGDTVVQNAPLHAWRNTGDTPATLVTVGLGVPDTAAE